MSWLRKNFRLRKRAGDSPKNSVSEVLDQMANKMYSMDKKLDELLQKDCKLGLECSNCAHGDCLPKK